MSDKVDVTCPCCSTRLVVDTASGEILSGEYAPELIKLFAFFRQ